MVPVRVSVAGGGQGCNGVTAGKLPVGVGRNGDGVCYGIVAGAAVIGYKPYRIDVIGCGIAVRTGDTAVDVPPSPKAPVARNIRCARVGKGGNTLIAGARCGGSKSKSRVQAAYIYICWQHQAVRRQPWLSVTFSDTV